MALRVDRPVRGCRLRLAFVRAADLVRELSSRELTCSLHQRYQRVALLVVSSASRFEVTGGEAWIFNRDRSGIYDRHHQPRVQRGVQVHEDTLTSSPRAASYRTRRAGVLHNE